MDTAYRMLANALDGLPNGFPATEDGAELRLLAKLFTPDEAEIASQLKFTLETAASFALRTGKDPHEVSKSLKGLARRGLITCKKIENGLGFGLMPFVVGFYENQMISMDQELAQLFEDYYKEVGGYMIAVEPQVHRIVPVNETIKNDMEIRPYESAASILDRAQSWGVVDCICRKQKALIGEACQHPIDMCMVLSPTPGVFENVSFVRSLTKEGALETLQRAAQAGLVHSVNNSQKDVWYICNCCTCSCGVLRGIKEMGLANVVARSAFVNSVNEELCTGCESCLSACQFNALSYELTAIVDEKRCVGCGVCVVACPEGALALVRRAEEEIAIPPEDESAWRIERAQRRGINFEVFR